MLKLPELFTQMNRSQILVSFIGVAAIGYILVTKFVLKDDCLNRMCPVNDYSWVWQIGLLTASTAVAFWLLKDNPQK